MKKKIVLLLLASATLIALVSCSTVTGLVSKAAGGAAGGAVQGELAEFKADEVLCAADTSMMDAQYYLAKVLKAASADTKNQAQVVYVRNGSTEWVNFVVKSHKAAKKDMEVGKVVFLPGGWAEHNKIDAEEYRKATWVLGRITSTDELFKDIVEVKGDKFYIQLLRIPDQEIEE
jgi:hypothetical protein